MAIDSLPDDHDADAREEPTELASTVGRTIGKRFAGVRVSSDGGVDVYVKGTIDGVAETVAPVLQDRRVYVHSVRNSLGELQAVFAQVPAERNALAIAGAFLIGRRIDVAANRVVVEYQASDDFDANRLTQRFRPGTVRARRITGSVEAAG